MLASSSLARCPGTGAFPSHTQTVGLAMLYWGSQELGDKQSDVRVDHSQQPMVPPELPAYAVRPLGLRTGCQQQTGPTSPLSPMYLIPATPPLTGATITLLLLTHRVISVPQEDRAGLALLS